MTCGKHREPVPVFLVRLSEIEHGEFGFFFAKAGFDQLVSTGRAKYSLVRREMISMSVRNKRERTGTVRIEPQIRLEEMHGSPVFKRKVGARFHLDSSLAEIRDRSMIRCMLCNVRTDHLTVADQKHSGHLQAVPGELADSIPT